MVKCVVNGCSNYDKTNRLLNKNLSFFTFPKDKLLRERWFRNIGEIRESVAIKHAKICSDHFTTDSFTMSRKPEKYTSHRNSPRHLLPDSVPTLNLKPSEQRLNDATDLDFEELQRIVHLPNSEANRKHQSNNDQQAQTSKRCKEGQDSPNTDMDESPAERRSEVQDISGNKNTVFERTAVKGDSCETNEPSHQQSRSSLNRSSDSDLCRQYKIVEVRCVRLDSEVKMTGIRNRNMFVKIAELKRLNAELREKLQAAEEEKKRAKPDVKEMAESMLGPYFTEGQIRCILEERKCAKWTIDDYAAAISLRNISPKAYQYMQNKLNFPLPSLSALRKWALFEFDTREGFLTDVLAVMKEKSKALSPMDKITVLTFDEMTLTPELCFHSKLEKLVGPCGKVQVIMIRGLFGNWQQPIYYKFDQTMTKAILDEALTRLHDAGYQVVATACDSSYLSPRGIWGELGINVDNHFFPHPSIEGAFVYVFIDVPHLLKLLRNWLMDEGFFLHSCKEKFTADIYQTLVNLRSEGEPCGAHRITQLVLDARNTLKEAVWPAAQIWSNSAGKAIQWAGDQGLLDSTEYTKFADFVLTVNSWFDVQNSQTKYGTHQGVNGFGVDLDQQERILLLMTLYMQHMRVGSQRSFMPFQQGVIISNASLRGLYKSLKNKYPEKFECLVTRRLQLDVLQNFFSNIRATGVAKDCPSGQEFRHRLRCYILGKRPQDLFNINRNTEEDSSPRSSSLFPPRSSLDNDLPPVPDYFNPLSVTTPHSSQPDDRTLSRNGCDTRSIHNSFDVTSVKSAMSATRYSCSQPEYEIHPNLTTEVILTQELFTGIVDVSSDQLEDQSNAENIDEDCPETSQYDHDDCNAELDEISRIQRIQEPSETSDCQDVIQESGLKYLAGYVAHRFLRKYQFLGEAIDQEDDGVLNEGPNLIQNVSKGHLVQPSKSLLDLAKVAEVCFSQFHGEGFSKEDQVVQKVVESVKNSEQYNEWIPEEVLQCLVKTRTYIRVRELNKRMCVTSEKQRVEEKIKKLPKNWKPFAKRTLQQVSP